MSGKQSVYVENSVISYLAARISSNLLVAAHQQVTLEWWEKRRNRYRLFSSELVVMEAGQGRADLAAKRMTFLEKIPKLTITDEVQALARAMTEEGAVPAKAAADAVHIAIAACHEVDYLLTWNCTHIANAEMVPVIRSVCAIHNYACPQICTPEELMGDDST